ncbi:hypothetical protein HMPREF3213_02571 [Heyndrickxia coagulans]|uniref:Uncharacterized protein n=1 Tax=Heyndrickxia coagulans TaxID=1398 RepID=A0A133KIS2_HEYCO|nr:hypothetical protein HMPREF3213_02571 [Heyndrickxia coagulans]
MQSQNPRLPLKVLPRSPGEMAIALFPEPTCLQEKPRVAFG